MRDVRALIVSSCLGLLGAGAIASGGGCKAAAPDAAAAEVAARSSDRSAPPIAVRLAPVGEGPVERPIFGTGSVRLKSETDLSFKVGGIVRTVLVDQGARVKKGQVLARLDPTEVDAALRQAKAGAAKAERDLDRVRRLHSSGALPVAELQNAETGVALSRAAVDAAAFNAQRAVIVAPDDGRVDRRILEPGEVVAPGRPAFRVSGRSKGAIVRVALADRDVLRVREGDEARVILDAQPETPLSGKVARIASVATPGIGTFDVEVQIDMALPVDKLLSGLTAKVEIRHPEDVAGIVPIGAIVDGRGADAAVFVVDQGRARRVPVKVAFLLDGRAALADAPLQPRAMVVEAGSTELEDGSPVRVLP